MREFCLSPSALRLASRALQARAESKYAESPSCARSQPCSNPPWCCPTAGAARTRALGMTRTHAPELRPPHGAPAPLARSVHPPSVPAPFGGMVSSSYREGACLQRLTLRELAATSCSPVRLRVTPPSGAGPSAVRSPGAARAMRPQRRSGSGSSVHLAPRPLVCCAHATPTAPRVNVGRHASRGAAAGRCPKNSPRIALYHHVYHQ